MPDKGLMNFSHTKLIIKIMSVDHVNDEYKTIAYYMQAYKNEESMMLIPC